MATILHIDDDPLILKAIRRYLERNGGHTVHSSDDPCEGENLFKEHEPDLLILDVAMPVKSGLEVFDDVKATGKMVPILFCTGHSESFNMDCEDKIRRWTEGFADGMTDIIYKPFELATLSDKVEGLVGLLQE